MFIKKIESKGNLIKSGGGTGPVKPGNRCSSEQNGANSLNKQMLV